MFVADGKEAAYRVKDTIPEPLSLKLVVPMSEQASPEDHQYEAEFYIGG